MVTYKYHAQTMANGTRVQVSTQRGFLGELLKSVLPFEKVSYVYTQYCGVRIKLTSAYGDMTPAQIVSYKAPGMLSESRTIYVVQGNGALDAVGFIIPILPAPRA